MKLSKAVSYALGSKSEKYLPPQEEFLKEFGVAYEQEFLMLKSHWNEYRRWSVSIVVSLFSVATMATLYLIISVAQWIPHDIQVVNWVIPVSTDVMWGALTLLLSVSSVLYAIGLGVFIIFLAECLLCRVAYVRRKRERCLKFAWTHRALTQAVVRYNRAHPLCVV